MLNSLKQWFKILALLVALVACGLQEPAPTTEETADPKAVATNGLTGVYYDNTDFTGITKTRVDATINKTFGTAAPITGIAATTYSVRWTGQIMPAFSQTYTFYLTSSDGARLMVNGQVLVNDWKDGASRVRSGTVALVANTKYDIRLEYYRNATNASTVKLEWQSTSRARQVVPTGNLFPTGYSVPDVIAILQANTTFKATNLVLNPDLTTVSSGSKGKAFESIVEDGVSLIFGRIDLSGNVDYLLKYTQNLDTVKFYDLLLKRSVDIGKFSDLVNIDGTLNTNAKDNLVKALAKVYLDYDINSLKAVSVPSVQTRLVVDNLCELILPPPSACTDKGCIDYAESYRKIVCSMIGGIGDPILGAALGGLGVAAKGPQLVGMGWKILSVGGGAAGGALASNSLGAIANTVLPESDRKKAWSEYLECIAGHRFSPLTGQQILGCPPILDGPNPNPINITDILGHEGFVAVRWGNKAPVGNGLLEYGFQLQGQGLGISVSLSDTSLSLLPPIIQSGTVAAGSSTTRYIWYKCSQIPSTWTGTFTLSHNAPNISSPVVVPVTINCVAPTAKISVVPASFAFMIPLNTDSALENLTITNDGDATLTYNIVVKMPASSIGLGITYWNNQGTIAPHSSSSTVSLYGSCRQDSGTVSGTFEITSNAVNVTSPVIIPITIRCFAFVNRTPLLLASGFVDWAGAGGVTGDLIVENTNSFNLPFNATLEGLDAFTLISPTSGFLTPGLNYIKVKAECKYGNDTLDARVRFFTLGFEQYPAVVTLKCYAPQLTALVQVDGESGSYNVRGIQASNIYDLTWVGGDRIFTHGEDIPTVVARLQALALPLPPIGSLPWERPCQHTSGLIGDVSCRIETWNSAKVRIPKDYTVGP
jgi:PA14 domain